MKNNGEQILEGKPTIATLLEITDQAVEKKKTAMSAAEILDLDETIKSQIPTVMALAKQRGITITEDDARNALIEQIEKTYDYIPPIKDKVGDAWVDRKRIGKAYGRPVLGVVLAGALIFAGVKFVPPALNAGKVAGVEKTVEQLYQQRAQVQKEINSENAPDLLSGVNAVIARTDGFFNQYCDGGEASDDISINNYKQAEAQIPGVKTAITTATGLLEEKVQFDQVSTSARQVVREEAARVQIDTLYQNGLNYIKAVDTTALKGTVDALTHLNDELKLVYTVRIVQRVGVDTGFIWGADNGDPSLTSYYFNVEAVGPNGKIIPMQITGEKEGKTKIESYWLERVPEPVYRALETDFNTHNGNLTDDTLAKKEMGNLSWTFKMSGMTQRLGQLTDGSEGNK